ncbi:MAG TPA: DUF4232 domain-containing protein [Candidatus Binatia bacterium]|nr:DUF4232 domain-containing protein [Candidatus Binatia bacterium]
MTRRFPILLATTVLAVFAADAGTSATPRLCAGRDLHGSFTVIRGSAGAGSISYRLRLANRSTGVCFVTGLPVVGLLDIHGKRLPTHVRPSTPGAGTAVIVRLEPGDMTTATARFSPDVPGPGEPTAGRKCEPTAYKLRVGARGGGATVVSIRPATPVCEHGSMSWSLYGRA